MPTYDYKCESCGFEFESFHKVSELRDDGMDEECPKCKSPCKRQISGGTGIIFKGPGFYCNDYPNPDKHNNKKKEESNGKEKEISKGKGIEKGGEGTVQNTKGDED